MDLVKHLGVSLSANFHIIGVVIAVEAGDQIVVQHGEAVHGPHIEDMRFVLDNR